MKKTCVPRLRFAEFKDSGEWEENKLGQLLKIGNGRDYKHLSKGDIPVYGTGGYMLSVDEYLYDGESVCIGRKGTIDKPFMLYGKFWNVDTLFYTHSFNKCTPKFIYACFQNINWYKYNSATGVPSLTKITIENIQLLIPTLPEQQKIADCLSSLDELIDLQSQKLESLKQHKKGLMQKLFPAEGKTTPACRFAEFKDSGEWEEKVLSDVCENITQGGTPDTTKENYWNGNIEWLTPAEMAKSENYFIYSTSRKITELGLKNCSSILLPINSIIMSTRAPIGHLAINKSNMAINQGCKGLILNKDNNYIFLYYLLYQNKKELNDLGAGNTFKELSSSTLKNFKIFTPKLYEQQKIADCLSSIDEIITLQSQKLASLKQHKKGLMQGIFPNDEII